MTFRPTLLERAYQLAEGGLCFSLNDIKSALYAEGFTTMQINTHLQGLSVTRSQAMQERSSVGC